MKKLLSLFLVFTLLFTAFPAALAQESALQIVLDNVGLIRSAYDGATTATAEEKEAVQALLQVNTMEEAEMPQLP